MLILELPWPESLNNYKTIGAIVKTKTGKLYQQRRDSIPTKVFYWKAYQAIKKIKPAEGFIFARDGDMRLEVTLLMHCPIKIAHRAWDLDNRIKLIWDSLTRYQVIADDSQFSRLLVEKMAPCQEGKVIVRIGEYHAH